MMLSWLWRKNTALSAVVDNFSKTALPSAATAVQQAPFLVLDFELTGLNPNSVNLDFFHVQRSEIRLSISQWHKILFISQDKPWPMKIQENLSLKPFNTFGIDKKAQFFTIASSIEEVKDALEWAKQRKLPVFILGGGSNILLTQDVAGLVIKIDLQGIKVISEVDNQVLVEVGAGVVWHDWVLYSLERNWAGIENLSLIPGTVGASPMQNIGAYGVEIKDVFHSLKALNRNTLELETFDAPACNFGYRESVFKHESKDKYIITSVCFRLSKNPEFHVGYGAIQDVLKEKGVENLSIQAVSNAVIEIRQSKLPDPKQLGNAGSFFKNPTIPVSQFENLKNKYPLAMYIYHCL